MDMNEDNLFANLMTPGEIARFSPVAGRVIPNIMRCWALSDEEGATLLGVSAHEWSQMKAGVWEGPLSHAQLERASLLIGIFRDTQLLCPSKEAAYRWVSQAIDTTAFEGRQPLDVMLSGSEGLMRIRRWLLAVIASGY